MLMLDGCQLITIAEIPPDERIDYPIGVKLLVFPD
jgi:hypothetical protein